MNKNILNYIEECEGWKVGIKNLHWSADNMSQHELCDDIADEISNFEDLVSEIEQSISGKIKLNGFTPKSYKITSLKSFVEDVISASKSFLKKLEGMGEKYVGIKSECETFIGTMQRKLYLVNFTLKEELKKRLRDRINESRPKNLANIEDVEKFMGRRPKTIKARINQIYRIVKRYGIDSKLYHDDHWQAKDDYYRAITSLGCDFEMRPCGNSNNLDNWDDITSDGGYCDYAEDGMPRSKQYAIKIMYDDGMNIGGYIKFMAAGRVDDPFSSYDTCMILWPKNNRALESRVMGSESINENDFMRRWFDKNEEDHLDKVRKQLRDRDQEKLNPFRSNGGRVEEGVSKNNQIRLTEEELKQIIKETATKILTETPLNYDIDNFSGRWSKNMPDDYIDGESEGYFDDPNRKGDIEYDLDDYASEEGDTRPMKDIENDYSWGLYDNQPIAQSPESGYAMSTSTKAGVPFDVDKAISMRNRGNNWTDRELRHGGRVMDKYVHGKYDGEDVGDAWDDLHYDSKEPMKVTESEVKELVREAAMQIINEYNQRMANTKRFVRSTHGHGDASKRRKMATPEERAETRRRLGIPELEKVTEESIDIDPKNKGKFTATKKATGKSTEELTHSKNPLTRKRANFAKMAKRHWKPLKESDYMDDGNLESQYGKNPDSMWTYGTNLNPSVVDGLEPNQVRHAGNGNIKNDNNASWDYFDAVSNGADMKMRNRLDADYRERTNNSPFNGIRKRMDMAMAFPRQTPNERFKQDLDKQWKDTQDIEKYSRQADSRPLHRKGSLNRA